ncbi:hypothetical protein LTR70_009739 [Exophiala xenobiotica]|uniref:Uncharacterized protein n=1 Tax=Lithohypha guttulata TaxID=1690604 RepID=A0ABR0JWN7_9EURO|nr:hypothetical protein LTR24_009619 [Lithohypha guttulata]KAK5310086.1 hypothetical protein LTR70_009739 [Exophiala xenobiotica]
MEAEVSKADTIRIRSEASRREAYNKHWRKDDVVQEQGSRHLHRNEIDLCSCRFFDLDTQDNVTFFVDVNGNGILHEEVNFLETVLAEEDKWCRVGERYYRRTVDPIYIDRNKPWWRRALEQHLNWIALTAD